MRIIYMGTPEFAIAPLQTLLDADYNVVAVITAPDKPAGRGKKIQQPPIKTFALSNQIPVLQPAKLKDPAFISELKLFRADLQVVVAFRMLPEIVWNMPPGGTFNLHASILPSYRGAAPINWAIINGEKETGVSTFFINHEIDTGNIIFREKTSIGDRETAGELHDRLMEMGAQLVLKTVKSIEKGNIQTQPQEELRSESENPPLAPKITREDCRIDWNQSAKSIYNLIRGLSPYPAAFGRLESKDGRTTDMKIFFAEYESILHDNEPGTIQISEKGQLRVAAGDGYLYITDLQFPGKKRMDSGSFIRGFREIESFRFI